VNHEPNKQPLSPTSLAFPDAARLLSKIGGKTISSAMIEADLAAGAPVNADGTIHLVNYAAWLVKETDRGD
jgi:hypothetical protein